MLYRIFVGQVLLAAALCAAPLTITFSGSGTGSIGNTNFNNAQFTITVTSDTAAVTHGTPCCATDYVTPSGTATTVSIAGAGSATLTDNQSVFVNQSEQTIGIWHYNLPDWFTIGHPNFATYNLSSSFSATSGTTFIFPQVSPMSTTAGALRFTSVSNVTVSATVGGSTSGPPVITSAITAYGSGGISQNAWITLKGINLAPTSTPPGGAFWDNAAEFAQGRMPTQLNGVSVKVNNKPAYIWFYCSGASPGICSADQINALAPLDNTVGPVQVTVTSGGQTSAPMIVNMQTVTPSLLQFSTQGYVVATHTNYKLLGPTNLFQSLTTPASVGEEVIVYAVGFGMPSGPLVDGSISQSSPLPSKPVCQIGGASATVNFAGVITPGLYQLNIVIPNGAANGDNTISCTYGGATTPSGNKITVQR